ncbi:MAG: 4Fe-4S binding protein [Fusobacteriaceae bacterium]
MKLLEKPLIKGTKLKTNFYKKYTWIIFVLLLILPLFDIKFGILALISMILGTSQSLFSKGKPYCAYFCPRGGGLQKFLSRFSLGLKTPKFLANKYTRYGFTILLTIKVIIGIIEAKSLNQLGAAVYMGFLLQQLFLQ